MADIQILAIDLAKRSFQICATGPGGAVLFNRTVSRAKLEPPRDRRRLFGLSHAARFCSLSRA